MDEINRTRAAQREAANASAAYLLSSVATSRNSRGVVGSSTTTTGGRFRNRSHSNEAAWSNTADKLRWVDR